MSNENSAFVESAEASETSRQRARKITLPLMDDGSIDWDAAADKHKKAFIEAIKADPNGILQNIQEEAAQSSTESGIADATVVACANLVLGVEAVGFTAIGPKVGFPVLGNLHPIVAIKACTVTAEEMQPVMEPAKRLVDKYLPAEIMKYQDEVVVVEHLLKLSAAKFKSCVDLAMQIEQMKRGGEPQRTNGKVIDAEPLV